MFDKIIKIGLQTGTSIRFWFRSIPAVVNDLAFSMILYL